MIRTTALAMLLALGGCASTTLETFPTTAQVVEDGRLTSRGPALSASSFQQAADERIDALLAEPLTLPAAVEIAMLNSRGLQRVYMEQQVFRPSFVEQLAAARSDGGEGDAVEWTALKLALLPVANRESRYDFAEEYAEVVPEFMEVAEHVKIAWYAAVAANQAEAMMRQVVEAMTAQAELANEQYRAGTASRGEQAKRHLALGTALKEHAAARRELVETREALIRDLGLWGMHAGLDLPERLPDLPAEPVELDGIEDFALRNRMDLIEARMKGGAWTTGVTARSQVREAHSSYLTAFETAQYQRDVVMPLTRTSLDFAQQEYNGMLIGIYDLLDEVREQIEAGKDYVETLRDFWIAEAELVAAVGGALPEASTGNGDIPS